jgi:hypothetical protein
VCVLSFWIGSNIQIYTQACYKFEYKYTCVGLNLKMNTNTEVKLQELSAELIRLKEERAELDREKWAVEDALRKKGLDRDHREEEVTLEIRRLQNELGTDIALSFEQGEALCCELGVALDILDKINNDESTITLAFEMPVPADSVYSVHINTRIERTSWARVAFDIVIKTKSSAVERIVRKSIRQIDHLRGRDDPTAEEQEHIDLTVRRVWNKSHHGQCWPEFRPTAPIQEVP